MEPDEYLEFLAKEYLGDYVARGGSAIKLMVVGNETVATELTEGLARIGDGFLRASVDAASVRIHMVEQVFTAIARQIDWDRLACDVVRQTYERVALPAVGDADSDLAVNAVAAYHELNANEVYRTVRRALEASVLGDTTLSHQFRVAMLRMCADKLDRGDINDAERAAVQGWLYGEKVGAAALRSVGLHSKVARHNGRALLVSLTRWIRRAGRPGLVLTLDLERMVVTRRPPAGLRDGFYYSKAAVLDGYEVLRQLIDATDELAGVFVAVLLPPDLLTDEARGLPAYAALHLRVADEVRDRRRPNPYAALVRLGVRLEAVR